MTGGDRPRRPAVRVRMLRIGTFFGVPLYFAPSWLVIGVLLTATYGPVVERTVPDVSASSAYLLAAAYSVVFALCVLAHELGHTAAALLLRQRVHRVVIFFLGGVSEIDQEPRRPREELAIAAAGPFVSLLLAGAALLGSVFTAGDTLGGVLLRLLFGSNAIVVVFNLMPGLPLDGGRLLRAVVWAGSHSRLTGTRVGAWAGRVLAVGVILLTAFADHTRLGVIGGAICVLLAVYLWIGAGQALQQATLLDKVPGIELPALLRPGLLVPADLSVDAALRRLAEGHARGLVLVDAAERPAAIVDEARVATVPPDQRAWVSLQSVSRPLEPGLILQRDMSGEALLDAVRTTPATEYLVVDERGAPAGILATTDLAAALRT